MQIPLKIGVGAKVLIDSVVYYVQEIVVVAYADLWDQIKTITMSQANRFSSSFSRKEKKYQLFFKEGNIPFVRLKLRNLAHSDISQIDFPLKEIDRLVSVLEPGFSISFAVNDFVYFKDETQSIIEPPNRIHDFGNKLRLMAIKCVQEKFVSSDDNDYPTISSKLVWRGILQTKQKTYLSTIDGAVYLNFGIWIPIAEQTISGNNIFIDKYIKTKTFNRFNKFL